jgi:hypothetical protein
VPTASTAIVAGVDPAHSNEVHFECDGDDITLSIHGGRKIGSVEREYDRTVGRASETDA